MPARTKQRIGDLYDTLSNHANPFEIYKRVRDEGYPNLSSLIEDEDPTPLRDRILGIDGFTRILDHAGINTKSDPYGTYRADQVGVFFQGTNRTLWPEFTRRLWMQGSVERSVKAEQARELRAQARLKMFDKELEGREPSVGDRALAHYFSSDFVPGTVQRPYEESTDITLPVIEPAIPLTELIARTRGSDGTTYRRRLLVSPPAGELRLLRVTEAAELPKAKISESQKAVRLYKFGRALEASYEALRRLEIDDFALHVRLLRMQTEVDQVAAALDVAINGDGNAGTAATVYTKATLDPAMTINVLSLRAWMAFKTLWQNPYQLTTILANQDVILDVLLLNVGTANALLASNPVPNLVGQPWTPINNRFAEGVRFGITTDVAARTILGFDNRFAVEHIQENGSDISESERFITRQTEVLTFSMNEGYAIFDAGAVKLFNLNA